MTRYVLSMKQALMQSLLILILGMAAWPDASLAADPSADVGFVVLAADRGFVGNEEVKEAFDTFAAGRRAELVFATDERMKPYLERAYRRLQQAGAKRVVVAPLFVLADTPRLAHAKQFIQEVQALPTSYSQPYGESYFATEDLAERFRQLHHTAGARVVVVGYGASSQSKPQMEKALKALADKAAVGFEFASLDVLVAHDKKEEGWEANAKEFKQALAGLAKRGDKLHVIPFHLGPKLDGMMSFDATLKRWLPANAELVAPAKGEMASWQTWLAREANRATVTGLQDVGIVFLAHGSDFHWNETMREAMQPLAQKYKVEFAFSMADQPTVESALKRLEKRGAKAAVIVRVFGQESSFKKDVDRMLGLDVEAGVALLSAAHQHGGHGHGAASGPEKRIRTALVTQSHGGLDAHPLFAQALLDRALSLSKHPERDTVVLVAHGTASDHQNDQWLKRLEQLASHMRASGGKAFRAIQVATWREDWPEKRKPWIAKVRAMVEDAHKSGGQAIVIPARTTGAGFEKEFLAGLDYTLGSGFAPHPLFARWIEEQVLAGTEKMQVLPPSVMRTAQVRTNTGN